MTSAALIVRAEWDDEARVWVATSDDVPGLATEAENVEGLMRKLLVLVPELLDLNHARSPDAGPLPIELIARVPGQMLAA